MEYPELKICNCPIDSWEVTIVSGDEHFEDRTTIYHHCADCSEDYAIVDYDTGEILYLYPRVPLSQN